MAAVCVGVQLAEGGPSQQHSGFANPLYNQDDAAAAAAEADVRMDDRDQDGRSATKTSFEPAMDDSSDTLQLVERDVE